MKRVFTDRFTTEKSNINRKVKYGIQESGYQSTQYMHIHPVYQLFCVILLQSSCHQAGILGEVNQAIGTSNGKKATPVVKNEINS